MTDEHSIRIGWAGYLRAARCVCGWMGTGQRDLRHAERQGAEHLASAGQTR